MKRILIASAALALIAGSAVAADLPVKAAPAPVYSWTGFYFGINGGGAWSTIDTSLGTTNGTPAFFAGVNIPEVNGVGTNSFNNSSWLAGGQVGYVMQSGSVVLGFEAGFDWMNVTGSVSHSQLYIAAVPNLGFTLSQSVSSKWLLTLLARAGYDMGGGFIPYVTGGVAVADMQYSFNYIDVTFAPGCLCAATFHSVGGAPAIGAGLEWRVANHWSLRGEYLYLNFSSLTGDSRVQNPLGPQNAFFHHTMNLQESIARGMISYKY